MSQMTFDEADEMVELGLEHYRGLKVPKALHHEAVANIYGEFDPENLQPVPEQFADQGRLIAVLFWKLAQARGLVTELPGETPRK